MGKKWVSWDKLYQSFRASLLISPCLSAQFVNTGNNTFTVQKCNEGISFYFLEVLRAQAFSGKVHHVFLLIQCTYAC